MDDAHLLGGIVRIEVPRSGAAASRGTGFIVRIQGAESGTDVIEVLTALHVIADVKTSRQTGKPEWWGTSANLQSRAGATTVASGDATLHHSIAGDWALLRFEVRPPHTLTALSLTVLDGRTGRHHWRAFGYTTVAPVTGEPLTGHVTLAEPGRIHLYCDQAAAGSGGQVSGCSGAPCVVEGHVVGLIGEALQLQKDRLSVHGAMYAYPIAAIAEACGLPLAVAEPPPIRTAVPLKAESTKMSISALGESEGEAIREVTRCAVDELPFLPHLRAVTGSRRIFVDRSLKVIDTTKGHSRSAVQDEKPVSVSAVFSRQGNTPCRGLIFGESGSGKSSILSSIAEDLLNSSDRHVPLLVRLSALPWETRTQTLLSALVEYVSLRTGVVLPLPALTSAFEEGKIILLLDGLDEIQDRATLQQVRGAVGDFSRIFPRCSVVVTCRPWVQADLPAEFARFELFRLVPLSIEGITELIRQIFALQAGSGRSAHDAEELVRFIEAHRDLMDLAGNPLLCSLVTLISLHAEPDAYRTRARILERSLDLMIRGWPRETGRDRTEFDDALSRAILQSCARTMHGGLVVGEERFLDLCIEHMHRAEPRITNSKARSRAIRWIEWQRERVGLLCDTGGGRVAFVHRSFQDSLVAAAVVDEFYEDVDGLSEFIFTKLEARHHDLVALLLTAQQAPAALADHVAASLLVQASDGADDDGPGSRDTRWGALGLLTSFAAEGALFSEAILERIFDELARASIEHCSQVAHAAGGIQQVRDKVKTMLQRGHRHAPWLSGWFECRMLGSDLDLQHGALWIRASDLAADEGLLAKPGRDSLLAASLDFGYEHPWKVLASTRLTWPALEQWAARIPLESILARSVESLVHDWSGGARAMSVQLLRRAHWFAGETALGLHQLAQQHPTLTIPDELAWQQDSHVLICKTRSALLSFRAEEHILRKERHFELESNHAALFSLADHAARYVLPGVGIAASKRAEQFLGGQFAGDYSMLFGPQANFLMPWELPSVDTLLRPDRQTSKSLASFIWVNFFNRSRVSYKLCFSFELGEPDGLFLERAESGSSSEMRPAWLPIVTSETDEDLKLQAHRMLLDQLAEVHTGAILASGRIAGLSRQTRIQYLRRYLGVRCQNLWLLHNWDALALLAGERIVDPSVRTLLLALALAQYQTTWRWPTSSRWAEFVASDPPDDPQCAIFWHLCRQAAGGDLDQFFSVVPGELAKLAGNPFLAGLGRWMCLGIHEAVPQGRSEQQ